MRDRATRVDGSADALLLRVVPTSRQRVAHQAQAQWPDGAGLELARPVTWWELVDPASHDDDLPLALAATRFLNPAVVELSYVLAASPDDGIRTRLLGFLVDAARATPALMLVTPEGHLPGLSSDVLGAAGFVGDRSAGGLRYALQL